MKSLYFFATNYGKDPLEVYKYYFNHGSWAGNGYLEAFIIALICAVVAAGIFYFVIGRLSHKWSTMPVWIVSMLMSGIVCFVATDFNTGMNTKGYGLQNAVEHQSKVKTKELPPESAQVKALNEAARKMKQDFRKGLVKVKVVRNLCMGNFVYAILLFGVLSLLFKKGPTNYANNIPFK